MTNWEIWADGVLNQLGAPIDSATIDALWAWAHAETAPYDLMRWNNPLNTTEKWYGSRDSGAQPGPHDVQIYASITDGINATVVTIENGHYPTILAHLQNSVPRGQWADACGELGTWGTGCGFIHTTYGPAPGNLGDDLTPAEHQALVDTLNTAGSIKTLLDAVNATTLGRIEGEILEVKKAVGAIPSGGQPEPAETPDLTAKVDALTLKVDAIIAKLDAAGKAL